MSHQLILIGAQAEAARRGDHNLVPTLGVPAGGKHILAKLCSRYIPLIICNKVTSGLPLALPQARLIPSETPCLPDQTPETSPRVQIIAVSVDASCW